MRTLISDFRRGWEHTLLLAGRTRARRELLRSSDRALTDAGFSRELLEAGVGAWPWRIDDSITAARALHTARARRQAERRAIEELAAYSDAELTDLDIARADIGRKVREGRVGVETGLPSGHESERRQAA